MPDYKQIFKRLTGSKIKRDQKSPFSTIKSDDQKIFTLLPGKDRANYQGTLKGAGEYGKVKEALDEKGNKLAVKIFKLPKIISIRIISPVLDAKTKQGHYDEYVWDKENNKLYYGYEHEVQEIKLNDQEKIKALFDAKIIGNYSKFKISVKEFHEYITLNGGVEFKSQQLDSIQKNILREYETLVKLNASPALAKIDDKIYLFQPLLPGKPLVTHDSMVMEGSTREGYIPTLVGEIMAAENENRQVLLNKFLLVIEKIFDAINAMHAAGIIHHDLHPANILYDEKTQKAYPLDYGSAIFLQEFKPNDSYKTLDDLKAHDYEFCLRTLVGDFKDYRNQPDLVKIIDHFLQLKSCFSTDTNFDLEKSVKKAREIVSEMKKDGFLKVDKQLALAIENDPLKATPKL